MTIDREPFYKRELELKLSMSYGPGRHDPELRDSAATIIRCPMFAGPSSATCLPSSNSSPQGRITPKPLVTHSFPIERAEEAYRLMERGEPHLAILLTYSGEGPPSLLNAA